MKIIEQKVYKVEFKTKKVNSDLALVEAESMLEALEIFTEYHKERNTPDFKIIGIREHINIIKAISKTVSHTITVEL